MQWMMIERQPWDIGGKYNVETVTVPKLLQMKKDWHNYQSQQKSHSLCYLLYLLPNPRRFSLTRLFYLVRPTDQRVAILMLEVVPVNLN